MRGVENNHNTYTCHVSPGDVGCWSPLPCSHVGLENDHKTRASKWNMTTARTHHASLETTELITADIWFCVLLTWTWRWLVPHHPPLCSHSHPPASQLLPPHSESRRRPEESRQPSLGREPTVRVRAHANQCNWIFSDGHFSTSACNKYKNQTSKKKKRRKIPKFSSQWKTRIPSSNSCTAQHHTQGWIELATEELQTIKKHSAWDSRPIMTTQQY